MGFETGKRETGVSYLGIYADVPVSILRVLGDMSHSCWCDDYVASSHKHFVTAAVVFQGSYSKE